MSVEGERFRAGKRLWNAADDARLRAAYADEATASIAKRLRRTVSAVYSRAAKLGVIKSAAFLASQDAGRLRRVGPDHPGAKFWYPRGHVPANKGTRRPGYAPGRMKATQFKPGCRSGQAARNYRPIGSTRLIEGYLYRKVSEIPSVPYAVNWKLEHVLVWTKVHGPVPAGHAVIFCNGDQADIRLENLELVTRRQLMARNSVHNLPKTLAQAVQLLGALRRQIRRRTRHAEE